MHSKTRHLIYLIICFPLIVFGQLSGGGDLNPDLSPDKKAQEKWMDKRVGLSVHWGPSSLGGKEISWSRDSKIKKDIYDNYYKDFNPIKFDAKHWVKLMKRWGIKYISPTAKHHDGFALWFSEYTPYDMEIAKHKIDIMEALAKACKANDIMLGAYYSNLDWYHPDWVPYQYGGPGKLIPTQDDSPNLERYFKFMADQVLELINKYDVDFLQFDGEWDDTYTHEVGSNFYRIFHKAKPSILLSSRIDIGRRMAGKSNHLHLDGTKYAGDYQERERVVNHGNNVIGWLDHPWQAWVTIDKTQWSYNKTPVLLSKEELILDLISVIGNNGNYMINLGPRPDGSFEPEQITLMDNLGVWLKKHKDAVYGTRGGPFYPFNEGFATRKGKKAWLFITDSTANTVVLPATKEKLICAKVFGRGSDVPYTINENGDYIFNISQNNFNDFVKVVALKFDEDVTMVAKKEETKTLFINSKKIEDLTYTISSRDELWNKKSDESTLLSSEPSSIGYAFHTKKEVKPHIIIDLGVDKKVAGLLISNRKDCCQDRAKNLTVWVSEDGENWIKKWQATNAQEKWEIPLTSESMGAQVPGIKSKYIKLGLVGNEKQILHLSKVSLYSK